MKTISLFSAAIFACLTSIAQVQSTKDASVVVSPDPAQQQNKSNDDSISAKREVFVVVEQMPEFPGGDAALLNYIGKQVRYPAAARENNLQGKVILGFVVDTEGNITDVQVLRAAINDIPGASETNFSPGKQAMIDEAIRVVKSMPKWRPGKQNGREVNCKFNLPISFVLK